MAAQSPKDLPSPEATQPAAGLSSGPAPAHGVSSDSDDIGPILPQPQRSTQGSRSRSRAPTSRSRSQSASRRRARSADRDQPSLGSMRSTRPLRNDWDYEYTDGEMSGRPDRYWRGDDSRHPDTRRGSYYPPMTGRRPPRSYMNHPGPGYDREYEGDFEFYPETPTTPRAGFTQYPQHGRPYSLQDPELGLKRPVTRDGATNTGPMQINWNSLSKEERAEVMRIPLTQWMNSSFKNHFVATMGELIGTTMFLLFAFAGTEVANIQSGAAQEGPENGTTTGGATGFNVGVLLYISLIFGFSLMVNVWIFFRISGGLFNPAVTLAMVLVRAIPPTRAAALFLAQMCGGMLASVIVRFLFPENFNVRTTLGGGATLAQGVLIEAILTAELVFTIFMLAKEKHRATFMAPIGIGLALFIAELVGVQFTGGSLNPARSFGPCVITGTFDPEHWIYWVGPLGGSLIAVVFYRVIKTLEYEMANPGADGDPTNDPTVNPEKKAEVKSGRRYSES